MMNLLVFLIATRRAKGHPGIKGIRGIPGPMGHDGLFGLKGEELCLSIINLSHVFDIVSDLVLFYCMHFFQSF